MATYHCSINSVSRSEGRSSVAAASYRSADKLLDERTGITSDYTRKKGVEHSEIVLPKGVNAEWALDRQMLWNAAELSEKRKDSRVAREVEVSLPHELNEQERLTLTKNFSQYLSDQYKVAVDFAIHKPHDRSDERNFHAHILMTTREISEQGLTEKSVFEKDMRWLLANNLPTARMQYKAVREQWANFANKALEEKGLNIRIDHRSFEDQGIALAPTQHVGVQASRMQDRGMDTERQRLDPEDAKFNADLIKKLPHHLLKTITSEKSVFTQHDIAKAVHRYTNNLEDYQACLTRIMTSNYIIQLQPELGQQIAVYSTREQVSLEQGIVRQAMNLAEQNTHNVDPEKVNKAITFQDLTIRKITGDKGLSDEQKIAIRAVTTAERLAVVEGLAGAGKSTLLAAAKVAWQSAGYRVVGAALSGKAAEGLEESSGIASRTLASWEHSINAHRDQLDAKTVFVIDEAGMVSAKQLARFIDHVERTSGKLVLVGDSEQLQPINSGAPFRDIAERVQTTGLVGIRRQGVDWQRQASTDFSQQRTELALASYSDHGRVHFEENGSDAQAALVRDYVRDCEQNPLESRLVLAHRRCDVHQLNLQIRQDLAAKGLLNRNAEKTYDTEQGKRDFAPGDRFIFLENDRNIGVKNGMLGEVFQVREGQLLIKVEGRDEAVCVATDEYKAFDHGYATTIHKSQGATVDRSFVMASSTLDRHLSYVAMTRHRQDANLYVDREELNDLPTLTRVLSRSGGKKTTLDYSDPVNLDLPEREALVPAGRFENALNSYAQAHHSLVKQQSLNLPVLETQKQRLDQAHRLLEEVRPGATNILKQVLLYDPEASKVAADLTGRYRAEALVQRMCQWQEEAPQRAERERLRHQREVEAAKEAKKPLTFAQRWSKTQPLKGTLGEQYLRQIRAIPQVVSSDSIRFLPSNEGATGQNKKLPDQPSLVFAAKDKQGRVVALQHIFMDPQTGEKTQSTKVVDGKLGSSLGAAVQIQVGTSDKVIFSDDSVTGLTIAAANPDAHIYASLDSIKGYAHMGYLAKQHDAKEISFITYNNMATAKDRHIAFDKAAGVLQKQGFSIKVNTPAPLAGKRHTDFNDVLREKGLDQVKRQMQWGKRIRDQLERDRGYDMGR
jgi:Ti-type conjugative transfer relaxase TraA